jgi:hypothetical protein
MVPGRGINVRIFFEPVNIYNNNNVLNRISSIFIIHNYEI